MVSLKFFFNRHSGVVIILNVIGWVLNLWHLYHLSAQWGERGLFTGVTFLIYIFLCFLITLIRFIPWYPREHKGYGIELHFEKTLVPAGYTMVVTNIIYFLWRSCWPFLLFSILLFLIIQSVNCILIYFHTKDKDPTPPSYSVRSLYKKG